MSGADLARRVPSVTTVFPVSMRLAAGTRQIMREQREITIWWRVFASPVAIGHGIPYFRKHLLGHNYSLTIMSTRHVAPHNFIAIKRKRCFTLTLLARGWQIGRILVRVRLQGESHDRCWPMHLSREEGGRGGGRRGNGTLALDAFARGTGCIGYGSIPLRGRKPPRASHAN